MDATKKTYFISDTHFGAPPDSRGREADFVRWLDKVKADGDKLFLLGDIFDFWFSYKHVVPRGFVRDSVSRQMKTAHPQDSHLSEAPLRTRNKTRTRGYAAWIHHAYASSYFALFLKISGFLKSYFTLVA